MFKTVRSKSLLLCATASFALLIAAGLLRPAAQISPSTEPLDHYDHLILTNAERMLNEGRQTFRFDTFGDEAFWGDTLKLHQAIEGAALGGVGAGISPKTALALGLKVDVEALPANLIQALKHGKVNLDDPATTLALLKLNAVVDWGTITYWNAFVANLEMRGVGTFFDERLDNKDQFPIAAAAGFGHISTDPDHDLITKKLPALAYYQLSIPAPIPQPGIDFDVDAAERGDALFSGKAQCNNCHHEPLWTEPGWNDHKPSEINIESFQADRSPDHAYKTMNLAGLFVRENGLFMNPANKGGFYHDGRFKTLLDVVKSYNQRFSLGLTDPEMSDLVEYLKSLH